MLLIWVLCQLRAVDLTPLRTSTRPARGYYLDVGWGTYGFKAAPGAWKNLAELIATGRTPNASVTLPTRASVKESWSVRRLLPHSRPEKNDRCLCSCRSWCSRERASPVEACGRASRCESKLPGNRGLGSVGAEVACLDGVAQVLAQSRVGGPDLLDGAPNAPRHRGAGRRETRGSSQLTVL